MQRKPSWWPPEVLRVQICPRIELQSRRSLYCATLALPGAVSLCTFLEHRPVGAPQWPLLFLPFLTQAPLGPAPPPSRCPCPAGSCCSGLGILSLKPTLIRPQEVSESVSHSIMSNSLIPRSCSSVHGILQARILEWIAFPYARGSSEPRDRTQGSRASCTGRKVPYCLDLIPESRGGNGMQPRFWWSNTLLMQRGTTDWFQIGKGVCQGCILSPCLFNLYAEYIMRNARLDKSQAGTKIARRNSNDLRYADYTTLMAESKEPKSLLMKVKGKSEKVGSKLNIQKTKIMASGPITSWQIDGETMETVRDYFGGLQNHCRWRLQPWN